MPEKATYKSPWRFAFLALAILGAVGPYLFKAIFLGQALSASLAASEGSASIGIIGGADGPTAVFITGNPAWYLFIRLAVIALGVVGYLCLLRCKKK